MNPTNIHGMDDLQSFKIEVERFLVNTRMAPSRFGVDACNDPAFVIDLRAGREPRHSTMRKARAFMSTYVAKCEAGHGSSLADERARVSG